MKCKVTILTGFLPFKNRIYPEPGLPRCVINGAYYLSLSLRTVKNKSVRIHNILLLNALRTGSLVVSILNLD
jgi:hypothetical protein